MPTWFDTVAAWPFAGPWFAAALIVAGVAGAAAAKRLRRRPGRQGRQREADAVHPLAHPLAHPPAHSAAQAPAPQHDALTGLFKRADFEAALEAAAWDTDHRAGPAVAVLYVAVDDLRSINDAFGQQVGDALLVRLGRRLAGLPGIAPVLSPRLVARVGGDEFALLLEADEPGAIAMATHVCTVAARPFVMAGAVPQGLQGLPGTGPTDSEREGPGGLPDAPLALTVSIGVACHPAHGAWSRLLGHAGAAMRHVRNCGGNGHAVYAPAMSVDLRDQALLLQDLRQAAARGDFKLLYQPKIDATSLQVTAAEALLRWEHPVRGLVPPSVFIPMAERHGLMGVIGEWVIDEACRQAALWREHGLRMRIAINVSGQQLRHDHFVAQLELAARRHRVPPQRLTCEITESVAMEDTAQTRAAFQRLRRGGFHVSIDDFGTGHSSLAVLRRLPAAELKVDRHFVIDLESSASARSIVEAVIGVARSLGMRVVAEGVETTGQRDILVKLGCDELQGFLFARPMSAAALLLWADGSAPEDTHGGGTPAFRPSLFRETKPAQTEG
ncbi:MAG: bifunctional diguanylate cyclase/phosphodiesterase [Rubrivivax sp.]|nr:bifunctional diguanylate cyclase/phosphodiesterase [Rubrivivax sp.]